MSFQSAAAAFLILVFSSKLAIAETNPLYCLTEELNEQGQWENLHKLTYKTGDDDQVQETSSYIWEREEAEWKESIRCYNAYGQNGALIETECQIYDELIGQWINAQKFEFTYKGKIKSAITKLVWDRETEEWTPFAVEQVSNGASAKSASSLPWDHLQDISSHYDQYGRLSISTSKSLSSGMEKEHRTTFYYADGSAKTNLQPVANLSNYPNPVSTTTTFSFDLAQPAEVSLQIYNAAGAIIGDLDQGMLAAGQHLLSFDASDFSAGMYHYTLVLDGALAASNTMAVIGR